MDHEIAVRVSRDPDTQKAIGVTALPNPLEEVDPGDRVTWVLGADAAGLQLKVIFREVQRLPDDGSRETIPPAAGPFARLEAGGNRISGIVTGRRGRFIYDILDGDTKLDWSNRLQDGSPDGANFGGVDVPPKPPRN